MDDHQTRFKRIADFARKYREEELPEEESDANGGPFNLRFFLKRAFAGARSEELSKEYREAAEEVLRRLEDRGKTSFESDKEFLDELENAGVGNQYDRRMVVEILEFIEGISDNDVIEYVEEKANNEELETAFEELTDIFNVGPKKATLFLRDAVTLLELDECVASDDYKYLFPVDTWVHRVADELGIVETDGPDWTKDSEAIVDECPDGTSPIEFNQGAWYLGANAFDVLMDYLLRTEQRD